ncbi:GTP-binding protein [Zobellella aerophila]|uniref:GTP-binding protein n=1 Tax=Zobellella aerophila TaxID=870480 RepID=A0ABP6W2A1_9GAMM
MLTAIPTHLIMGFLGTGKTTLLRHLLATKPEHERWAILVNEFGEVGIDGALLADQGATIKEVPGGCLCCVSGLPFQIGLNALLHKAKPDRLLIEPSGLGHPSRIIDTLTAEHYQDKLALKATFCVVDPRQWQDPRYREHETYRDQVALSDILVANKSDLCSAQQLEALRRDYEHLQPAKQGLVVVEQGRLGLEWLEQPHDPRRRAGKPDAHAGIESRPLIADSGPRLSKGQPWRRYSNHGEDHFSIGWRFLDELRFDLPGLTAFCESLAVDRLKAVLPCDDGWRAFNMVGGQLSVYRIAPQKEGRLELIHHRPLSAPELQKQLFVHLQHAV